MCSKLWGCGTNAFGRISLPLRVLRLRVEVFFFLFVPGTIFSRRATISLSAQLAEARGAQDVNV